MSERSHLSIGEVLALLQDEFPDATISKIRFLESQSLISPERTPSGYRKFYEEDVERLRWIMLVQRDHFLPLKVIRERSEAGDFEAWLDAGRPIPPMGEIGAAASPTQGHLALGLVDERTAGSEDPISPTADDDEASEMPRSSEVAEVPGTEVPGSENSAPAEPVEPAAPAAPAEPAEPVEPVELADDEPLEVTDDASAEGGSTESEASRGGAPLDDSSGRGGTPDSSEAGASSGGDSSGDDPTEGESGSDREPEPVGSMTPDEAADPVDPITYDAILSSALRSVAEDRPPKTQAAATPPPTPAPAAPPLTAGPLVTGSSDVSLTVDELCRASGLTPAELGELERYGLLRSRSMGPTSYYDGEAMVVAKLSAAFMRHGVQARHLRMYKSAAEREAGVFEQVIMPLVRSGRSEGRREARDRLVEMARLGEALHAAMLRAALEDYIQG